MIISWYLLMDTNVTMDTSNATLSSWIVSINGKISILSVTFIATFVVSIIPIYILFLRRSARRILDIEIEEHEQLIPPNRREANDRIQKWKKLIGYANCFSGGVFLSACLLDLSPEAREAMNGVLQEVEDYYDTKLDYPIADCVILIGFFLVFLIEQLILYYKERHLLMKTLEHQSINRTESTVEGLKNSNMERQPLLDKNPDHVVMSVSHHVTHERDCNGPQLDTHPLKSNIKDDQVTNVQEEAISKHNRHHEYEKIRGEENQGDEQTEEGELHDHDVGSLLFEERSSLRCLVLLIALTFHSVFEGIAIGLQEEAGGLIQILIAVLAHKLVMAFSLGLNLAQSSGLTVSKFVLSNLVFSLASPTGIAIGAFILGMDESLARDAVNGVLQCIASGTFLYITFFEALPHEFTSSAKHRIKKICCVILGSLLICILMIWAK